MVQPYLLWKRHLLADGTEDCTGHRVRGQPHNSFLSSYFGLDGDNTGSIPEDLFLASSDEKSFRRMSEAVDKAVKEIVRIIREQVPRAGIIFAAGDDVLFKGCFDRAILQSIQQKYQELTTGLTCSIGYGRSFREVYLALKLAKTEPGKNSIVGLELQ